MNCIRNKHYTKLPILALLAFCLLKCSTRNSVITLSPDKQISVTVAVNEEGSPYYEVTKGTDKIIGKSYLGVEFQEYTLVDKMEIKQIEQNHFDETWETVWGQQRYIRNNYNEVKIIFLQQPSQKRMILHLRVFDNGVGFRYDFPSSNGDRAVITKEATQFKLMDDAICWWIPADYESYEYLYLKTRMSQVDATKSGYVQRQDRRVDNLKAVNTPVTLFSQNKYYISIHEAALYDYAGMTLGIKEGNLFESELVPWSDSILVRTKYPFQTPWRVVLIEDKAADLLVNNIVVNLNEPNEIENTDWIIPAKYCGIWWEMHIGKSSWSKTSGEGINDAVEHGATTNNAKKHIDFASDNNIQGVLVEGWNTGWEEWGRPGVFDIFDYVTPYNDFNLTEVLAYAKKKNIAYILHNETAGDAEHYDSKIENLFKQYNSLGVNYLKTGYAGQIYPKNELHHGQYMVNHYNKVVKLAAKHQINIDAHEPIKQTGLRRTYPNLMTQEGVRGTEYEAWGGGNPPDHTCKIPFTRGLAGPMDYTPGIFDLKFEQYRKGQYVQSTLAKQLALYIVLYSPLQMVADLPENYANHSGLGFIRQMAVDWDTTTVIDAQIGEKVIIARKERNGERWFVGGITNERKREIELSFHFLDKGVQYTAEIYQDGENAHWKKNPYPLSVATRDVQVNQSLRITMVEGGGFAAILTPNDQ